MADSVRILVVEDDPEILEGTARLLEKAGYTVDRAAGGEEALQAVRDHRPGLLLLDRYMPGIDGIEVCRRIKVDPALADVFVVMISGSYIESDEQAEGLESGADGYIARPIANRELLARVEAYVRIRRLTHSVRLHAEELERTTLATQQAYVASLNLMEDAVSAREHVEQTLRSLQESEERNRTILQTAMDGFWLTDMQGRLLEVNEVYCRTSGYSRPELLAMRIADLEVVETARETDAHNQRIEAQGEDRFESQHRRKDGSVFDVEVSVQYRCIDGGRMVVFLRDITERKEAEESMRRRLAELEALHTVSGALRTALTGQEALPTLLDETLAALETDTGCVWLYHPGEDELRIAAASGWFQPFTHVTLKPGEGVAGGVFLSGQTHISKEFAGDPLVIEPAASMFPAGWGAVCVPIRAGETTIGALLVGLPLGHLITAQQADLLESLAEMGGAALHRMSLYEETARRLDQLQAIHRVDQAISAGTDLRMTLSVVLEHVATQLQVDAADVLLLNPHTLTLEYSAGRGFRTGAPKKAQVRLGQGPAGRAALERRTMRADDLTQIRDSPRLAAIHAVEGFVAYHAVPLIAKGQVEGVLEVFHRASLPALPDWVDFLETLAGQAAIAIENAQLFEGMQRSNLDLALAYDATIEGWSHALDLRDKETEGHTQRVTEMTMRLARDLGIGDAELVHVRRGALLHDIGKMGVPDDILLKPGPLTDEEWVLMRRHPQLAYDLLAPIAYLRPALDIPYCHHERMDGSGYPRGLAGEQIPLTARLFAVIDVWDALRSDRPYRPAWTEEAALARIRGGAGTHFDPKVVEVFLRGLEED
jgi:PAS domain S-box-containing protein/putative nucleotidyltransferase with HDIG domain